MNPNHKPNWQDWTPIEGIKYWNDFLNLALEWYNESLADEITLDEFLASQRYLDCIEQILTHHASKELWKELEVLRIPPTLFLTEYHCALEGQKIITNAKRDNAEAEKIEKKANELIGMLDSSRYYSELVSDLDRILERARHHQSRYKREKQVIRKTQSELIDKTYLRESLSNFFKEWTQQPRHNLVKIALNVTFSKEFSTEKIKKSVNRNSKNK